jgi:hypothetical protein
MKQIPTVLGAAVALTLLAGCAGDGTYGTSYGAGSDSYGYRQPYPYAGSYRYDERRNSNYYFFRIPITTATAAITAADTRACKASVMNCSRCA